MKRNSLKAVACSAIFVALQVAGAPIEDFPSTGKYSLLLEKYVTPEGVRYQEWHENESDVEILDHVLQDWGQADLDSLNRDEATAFLINLYNAAMIDQVLEHYPLNSVREIGLLPFAVFRRDVVKLEGEKVSLDTIEKEILLKEYFDPRIHFAVNCASVSCPPLRAEAYRGNVVDAQLNEQTTLFANSSEAAQIRAGESSTGYSELFNWYDSDFPGDNPAIYLNEFRSNPLPLDNKIEWIKYNWALNEAPQRIQKL